ncbi:MAG: response regulator [Gammaproteobacteria bacterium]|jgi:CheY-like chemotaxis protein
MKTVLIVEDHQRIALALSIRLKSMGYAVVSASDAITAVGQAKKALPDVVVLDIGLPGGDGFVVAERLAQHTDTAATPLVFITASKQSGLRERAFELGATGFLEKPFKATDLADAIETALMAPDSLDDDTCEFDSGLTWH